MHAQCHSTCNICHSNFLILGALSYKSQNSLQSEIITLEKTVESLKQKNSQLQEMYDVTHHQLSQYQEKADDVDKEIVLLRQQVIELSSKSDFQVMNSRLQQQLLALHVRNIYSLSEVFHYC